jgi:hypothetical protein
MPFKRKPPPGNAHRVIGLGSNSRGGTTNSRGHPIQFESDQEHKLILLLILPTTRRQTAGYHASEYLFSIRYPSLRATAADARLST